MSSTLNVSARRHDLDWLRVIAFGLLVFFHAAVAFLPTGIPMTLNATPSPAMMVFVSFSHEFRLGLLIFVSGAGPFFALRSRTQRAYFTDRSRRLLIPLVFGVLIFVPPMVYLEKIYTGQFQGSLVSFYTTLVSDGTYPHGNLSWHHFWFIAYLYIFCLLGWPIFAYINSDRGRLQVRRLAGQLTKGAGIYLVILPLLVAELPLRPLFPGFRDLIHDWASFSHWFILMVIGYLFAPAPVLIERARTLR